MNLAELHSWLQSDLQFAVDIIKLINIIICYSMADILLFKVIDKEVLSKNVLLFKNISYKVSLLSLNKTDKEFALKLYKDNNTIAFKT